MLDSTSHLLDNFSTIYVLTCFAVCRHQNNPLFFCCVTSFLFCYVVWCRHQNNPFVLLLRHLISLLLRRVMSSPFPIVSLHDIIQSVVWRKLCDVSGPIKTFVALPLLSFAAWPLPGFDHCRLAVNPLVVATLKKGACHKWWRITASGKPFCGCFLEK